MPAIDKSAWDQQIYQTIRSQFDAMDRDERHGSIIAGLQLAVVVMVTVLVSVSNPLSLGQ